MSKFIVIDWLDGAWKNTQTHLLREKLEKEWKSVFILDYPRYSMRSSFGVTKYLKWEYEHTPNPYQASLLYSIDRLDDFLENKNVFNDYDYILANRYTSSNLIHQFARIWRENQKLDIQTITWVFYEFKNFLYDLEHERLELPVPDKIIILDVTLETSLKNIDTRWNEKDNHENSEHLKFAKKTIDLIFSLWSHFTRIDCEDKNGILRSKEDISNDLYKIVSK